MIFKTYLTIAAEPQNAVGALPASAQNLLPSMANNAGRVLVTDGDRAYWGTPAGVAAIGSAITGATAHALLYTDGSGDLAQSAGLTFGALAANQLYLEVTDAVHSPLLGVGNLSSAALGHDASTIQCYSDAAIAQFSTTGSGDGASATMLLGDANDASKRASLACDVALGIFLETQAGTLIQAGFADTSLTLPSLAGVGSRAVFVDANGKLSAP